jgi:hypothetical protein
MLHNPFVPANFRCLSNSKPALYTKCRHQRQRQPRAAKRRTGPSMSPSWLAFTPSRRRDCVVRRPFTTRLAFRAQRPLPHPLRLEAAEYPLPVWRSTEQCDFLLNAYTPNVWVHNLKLIDQELNGWRLERTTASLGKIRVRRFFGRVTLLCIRQLHFARKQEGRCNSSNSGFGACGCIQVSC